MQVGLLLSRQADRLGDPHPDNAGAVGVAERMPLGQVERMTQAGNDRDERNTNRNVAISEHGGARPRCARNPPFGLLTFRTEPRTHAFQPGTPADECETVAQGEDAQSAPYFENYETSAPSGCPRALREISPLPVLGFRRRPVRLCDRAHGTHGAPLSAPRR